MKDPDKTQTHADHALVVLEGHAASRGLARRGKLRMFEGRSADSQDQILALTVLYVPHSLDRGMQHRPQKMPRTSLGTSPPDKEEQSSVERTAVERVWPT